MLLIKRTRDKSSGGAGGAGPGGNQDIITGFDGGDALSSGVASSAASTSFAGGEGMFVSPRKSIRHYSSSSSSVSFSSSSPSPSSSSSMFYTEPDNFIDSFHHRETATNQEEEEDEEQYYSPSNDLYEDSYLLLLNRRGGSGRKSYLMISISRALTWITQILINYHHRQWLNRRLASYFVTILIAGLCKDYIFESHFSALHSIGDFFAHNFRTSKRNFLNVYFVKLGWLWTFIALIPFFIVTRFCFTKRKFCENSILAPGECARRKKSVHFREPLEDTADDSAGDSTPNRNQQSESKRTEVDQDGGEKEAEVQHDAIGDDKDGDERIRKEDGEPEPEPEPEPDPCNITAESGSTATAETMVNEIEAKISNNQPNYQITTKSPSNYISGKIYSSQYGFLFQTKFWFRFAAQLAPPAIRLAIATVIWYFSVNFFVYYANLHAECRNANSTIITTIANKIECIRQPGHTWHLGFDISGHIFLMSYSNLIRIEEMTFLAANFAEFAQFRSLDYLFHVYHLRHLRRTSSSSATQQVNNSNSSSGQRSSLQRSSVPLPFRFDCFAIFHFAILSLLAIATLVTGIWEFMMIQTAFFYHSWDQKVYGLLWAIAAWIVTYQAAFQFPAFRLRVSS